MKQYKVRVRKKGKDWGKPGELIEVIQRVLRAEATGNFSPVFCTYKGKSHLVQSELGDLSDPFRREESYLKFLYLEYEGA